MAGRVEQDYLVARAIEESELAAVAVTKTALVAHMQMASEYEERAQDFAAQLLAARKSEAEESRTQADSVHAAKGLPPSPPKK